VTFSHFTRRVHLYLGLALLPWFFMYGISSVVFAHNEFFQRLDNARGLPQWTLRSERTLDVAVPADPNEMRVFGAALLKEAGIDIGGTSFGTYRQSPTQINVYSYSFWSSTQLKYYTDRKTLTVEDRRFRWDQFLTGMHARGGFDQDGLLQDSWSVVVDGVCVAMIVWIASGLYMWWGLPALRRWGWLAIAAGTTSFMLFTLRL
jgi:hypothetical protein